MEMDKSHRTGRHDQGRESDWSKAAADYAAHRPGPPDRYYFTLMDLGVGLPGQRLLDMGTGTGVVARNFASRGVTCVGTDIAEGQLHMARLLARDEGLDVDFQNARAEAQPFPDNSFSAITANQCWIYFQGNQTLQECQRLLSPGGRLAITFFSFMPRESYIVALSEKLVLQFNPGWSGNDWDGVVADSIKLPDFAQQVGWFCYDEDIPFTRESWRGRMRALRGIGASLSETEVQAFDVAHAQALEKLPDSFTIPHRIFGYVIGFDG